MIDSDAYFADALYLSMKGAGTDDATLIRIIVSRSEIDLEQIKSAFRAVHSPKSLVEMVSSDTSGDYKKVRYWSEIEGNRFLLVENGWKWG